MITYYYQPLPVLPIELVEYCRYHNYPLSLKKKYIVAQLINLNSYTDIDVLLAKTGCYCNSISKSSIYQVLQWMAAHQLINKKITGDKQRMLYSTNFHKLHNIRKYNTQHNTAGAYNFLAAVC